MRVALVVLAGLLLGGCSGGDAVTEGAATSPAAGSSAATAPAATSGAATSASAAGSSVVSASSAAAVTLPASDDGPCGALRTMLAITKDGEQVELVQSFVQGAYAQWKTGHPTARAWTNADLDAMTKKDCPEVRTTLLAHLKAESFESGLNAGYTPQPPR
jgi:hypothetical protein